MGYDEFPKRCRGVVELLNLVISTKEYFGRIITEFLIISIIPLCCGSRKDLTAAAKVERGPAWLPGFSLPIALTHCLPEGEGSF